MKLTFLGATGTVTGSKYLLESKNVRILVDCGLFQGLKELRLRNRAEFPVDPASITAVVLTHAHLDHSGYLPLLVKNGFKGKIYCTNATQELCRILLPDSGRLQQEEADYANKKHFSRHKPALPLYTQADAEKSLGNLTPVDTNSQFQIKDSFFVKLIPSGHILGAAFVRISNGEKTITFSGDLGRYQDLVMRPPRDIQETDYLVVESTYGDREHSALSPLDQLESAIIKAVSRKAMIVVPAFSVGRSQTLLYCLYQLRLQNRIPSIPIFLDSPMSMNATEVFCNHTGQHKLNSDQCSNVSKVAHYVWDQEESKRLDSRTGPALILSASGMATGGRVLHHLKAFLPHKDNMVLLTGFQAVGTRGASLLNGDKTVKIHGEFVPVNAEIINIENLSAHADRTEILKWISGLSKPPKNIFITHGEKDSSLGLKNYIETHKGWNCTLPKHMQTVELT